MTREIPGPLRAAAGLAAVAVDEARRLPNRLASLPVLAVGAAMQASMRAQQRYAELLGRGDQVLSHLREPDEQPPWARFDEDEPSPSGSAGDPESWAFSDEQLEERLSELDAEPAETADGSADDLYAPAANPATTNPAPAADPPPAEVAGADSASNGQHPDKPAESAAKPRAAKAPRTTKPGKSTKSSRPKKAVAGADLPLANYDSLTLPQLRARISKLSGAELASLLDHERGHAARPPYLTMLENRLSRVTAN
jgi:hypothetical protein